MESEFLMGTLVNLLINIIYTITALFMGVLSLKMIDQIFLKSIDLEEEIKKGNLAASIFAATILIFVAIIVSVGLKS